MGAIAKRAESNRLATQSEPFGLAEQMRYAQTVSTAGIVPASYKGKPADILIAMGLGQSMGLSPAESLYRINVIQGKPTASAELVAAQVRKAGHKLRIVKDEQHVSVTATIVRADDPDYPFTVTRDQQWAQRMGLVNKDNYRKQPLTMLTWRAITAVAREACPEALYGVAYTPDEMTLDAVTPPPDVPEADVQPEQDDTPSGVESHTGLVERLVDAFQAHGYEDWTTARPIAEQVLNQPVQNVNTLSDEQLHTIINHLNTMKENTNEQAD